MADMPKEMPPGVQKERKGSKGRRYLVYYVRKDHHGKRIRLREKPFSEAWYAEYHAIMAGTSGDGTDAPKAPSRQGSLEWLIDIYRHSPAWAALAASTRRQRENIFKGIIENTGDVDFRYIDRQAVERGKDRRMATPFAAKNYLKTLRALFKWAVSQGHMESNPAEGVEAPTPKNHTGFHTWSEEEISRYQDKWPLGTRERLAFDVLLYTGLRRGDACVLGRQHVREGVLSIRLEKSGFKEEVTIPVLPELAASIQAGPTGDLAFIATKSGRPFKKESFGTWFRIACREAKCPGSAHGLRKAAANRLAEGGATVHQLNAWFGWRANQMALKYTQQADRKRLARDAATIFSESSPSPETFRPHPEKSASKTKG